MASVRVTCPECNYSFGIADHLVGGLVLCRDCKAEFRVEFAEEDDAAPESQPKPTPREQSRDDEDDRDDDPPARSSRSGAKTKGRTVRRPDTDEDPEEWKSDLPIRSPLPILLGLVGVQAVVALLLVMNWFFPTVLSTPSTGSGSYYQDTTSPTKKTPTTRW